MLYLHCIRMRKNKAECKDKEYNFIQPCLKCHRKFYFKILFSKFCARVINFWFCHNIINNNGTASISEKKQLHLNLIYFVMSKYWLINKCRMDRKFLFTFMNDDRTKWINVDYIIKVIKEDFRSLWPLLGYVLTVERSGCHFWYHQFLVCRNDN